MAVGTCLRIPSAAGVAPPRLTVVASGCRHDRKSYAPLDSRRTRTNAHGQPIGDAVPGWQPRPRPDVQTLTGSYCRLERLDPARHPDHLVTADQADADGTSWTYLPYGPFADRTAYSAWITDVAAQLDPYFFAVVDTEKPSPTSGGAVGVVSLMQVQPGAGSIEVGHIHFSQHRRAGTEAHYLLGTYVFEQLGYRRYEWKCDALNEPSRRAADRLGFEFEGIFRQAQVVKGQNRDTAWYAIIDAEWPRVRESFQAWLAPVNFDAQRRQRSPLRARR
jgi:RimJ/RimL family protein N-acetyltransferase